MSPDHTNQSGAPAARPEDLLAHASWVRGVAYALVRDAATADDVVQETWLAALRQPPSADRPIRPWLAGVVRNLVRDRRRGAARRVRREETVAVRRAAESLPTPDELAARLERQQRLAALVGELPEALRTTVLLRYYEGLSAAEIARRQGVPAGTVRWRLHRAIEVLRGRLDADHDGDRRAWSLALVPLAASFRRTAVRTGVTAAAVTYLLQGVLTMGLATKITVAGVAGAAALGILLATGVVGGPDPEPLPVEPVDVAFVPLAESVEPRRRRVVEAATAAVEAATPAAATEPRPAVVLVGRAVDESGAPLADIVVHAQTHDEVVTGADGVFSLRSERAVSFGTLELTLSAPGRATAVIDAAVATDAPVPVGDIVLLPGGAISGRVVDAAGQPLAGGWASVEERAGTDTPYDLRRRLATAHGAGRRRVAVAEDGTFRIDGAPAGVTRVWAGHAECVAALSGPVEVRPGMESRGVELRLDALPPEIVISGRVLSPDGEPVPEADLRYEYSGSWGRSGSGSRSVDADGSFRIVLTYEATYRLTATDDLGRWGGVSVEGIEGGARDVVLQLPAVRRVRLLVTDRGGAPVPTFTVSLQDPDRGALFDYASVVDAPTTGADVRVPAQSFHVEVEAPGFATGRAGPLDPDRLGDAIRIVLDPLPGVRGRVTDADGPVVGARVSVHRVVPSGERVVHNGFAVRTLPDDVASGETGADGTFDLTVREPGRYVVRAERAAQSATQGAVQGGRSAARAAAESGEYDIDPAAGLSGVDLVLGPGGVIEGAVLVSAGRSPAGTIVGISRGDGFAASRRVGADGAYRFEGLLPGDWEVRVLGEDIVAGTSHTLTSRGGFDVAWSCRVVEGGVTRHDLPLDATGARRRIVGSLRIDGAPAVQWTATLLLGSGGARERLTGVTLGADGAFALATLRTGDLALILGSPSAGLRFLVSDAAAGSTWAGRVDLDVAMGRVTLRGVPAAAGPETAPIPELALIWIGPDGVLGLLPIEAAEGVDDGVVALAPVPAGRCRIARFDTTGVETDPLAWDVVREFDVLPGGTIDLDLSAE